MEKKLQEIIEDMAVKLSVKDSEDIRIIKKMTEGFSKAEVYFVEIKEGEIVSGYYYLKIDSEAEEYKKNNGTFRFTKVAKCIKKYEINNYYVMLLQIAGRSAKEYKSFYSIYSSNEKEKAARKLIREILNESINEKCFIGQDISPSILLKKQLKNKIEENGILERFLLGHLSGDSMDKIRNIKIDGEIYPNAFLYAINDSLWKGTKIKNIVSAIHGDLHGNNIFVSENTGDYALIDMAYYREDGFAFYDTAYFEYSLMIYNMGSESIDKWLFDVEKSAKREWQEVDYKDCKVIRAIAEVEEEWIEKMTTDECNYIDSLRVARLFARVIVGLNYAGKRSISDSDRLKAYMYACCYLKRMLNILEIDNGYDYIYQWKNDNKACIESQEYSIFLNWVSQFDDSRQYYLISGQEWNYSKEISANLAKIHWSGGISFNPNKGLETFIEEKTLVKKIIPNNISTLENIKKKSVWWIYANGIIADPESITNKFGAWRNKYRKFWEAFSSNMVEAVTDNDLLFIIDGDTFKEGDEKYVRYLFDELDAIERVEVTAIFIGKNNMADKIDADENENIHIFKSKIGMRDVAEYCNLYLPEAIDEAVYIPNRLNHIGVPLQKEDRQYIEQYTTLVHEQLVRKENIQDEKEKHGFYFGKPISWTAIEERLYVRYSNIEKYKNDISEHLKNITQGQMIIQIAHFPGAGASILGRVICWELKKEYPTIVLEDKFNDDMYESLFRLARISGKHLLVFLDGNYNQNDVNQFLWKTKGIKICILYAYRVYNLNIRDDEVISILNIEDGKLFSRSYERILKQTKKYDAIECKRRVDNMNKLTTENNMIEFRLPFFYGMHAFEEDYDGIQNYLNEVVMFMEKDKNIKKTILYIALITYYTENFGLGFKCARKLLNNGKQSGRQMLENMQSDFPSIIYIIKSSLRICHPIIAKKILEKYFKNFQSEMYKNFCIEFIEDLRKCEGVYEKTSDIFSDLMVSIFIKRDTGGELKVDYSQKKSFSQIILEIGNPNLQEQIYKKLVEKIPDNPLFRQHYGRLLIANNPTRINEAEEQLNVAIKMDQNNGSYYHSRGNIYVQYVLHQMNNEYKNLTASELYNKVCQYVDMALLDFERSVKLEENGNNISDLVYPYTSIIQITTSFVHQLAKRSGYAGKEKEFLESNSDMAKWSKKIISTAMLYDIDTEYRYNLIRDNEFYKYTRNYLGRYKWTSDELEACIKQNPEDYNYQIAYLGMCINEKKDWRSQSQQQIESIIFCCENLIKTNEYKNEGVLWKWFNACIRLKRQHVNTTYSKMFGILETLPDLDTNATANYFLAILYFCKYMQTKDEKLIDAMYKCFKISKRFAGNKNNQSITHYYYMGVSEKNKNSIPIEFDRNEACKYDATIINAESIQSGYLTLNINPNLKAFFVPLHADLKKNQEIGQLVKVKVGFRFDGLSAWEIERIK